MRIIVSKPRSCFETRFANTKSLYQIENKAHLKITSKIITCFNLKGVPNGIKTGLRALKLTEGTN